MLNVSVGKEKAYISEKKHHISLKLYQTSGHLNFQSLNAFPKQ